MSENNIMQICENGRIISFRSIALSKFFELALVYTLNTITSILLAGYSDEAVSVSGLAGQLNTVLITIINIPISGAFILNGIAFGKKDRNEVGKISGTATVIVILLSCIIAIFSILFTDDIFRLMNADETILPEIRSYFQIVMLYFPLASLLSFANNLLICNGYPKYSMITGILRNVLYVILCYIVLYMIPDIHISGLNAVAISGAIACTTSFLTAVIMLYKINAPMIMGMNKRLTKSVLKIGVPAGMSGLSYNLAQTITTGFIVTLGMNVYNTKIFVSTIVSYSSLLSMAMAQACALLIGRYTGRGEFDNVKKLHIKILPKAIIANVFVSGFIYIFRVKLLMLFTDDNFMISLGGAILLVDIVLEIVRAVNQVTDQSLNAVGDVKTTMLTSMTSCWLCSVFLSYIFGIKLGFGLMGVWVAFLTDELLKSVIYMIRWKNEKWKCALGRTV